MATLPPLQPHTAAKHLLLQKYLNAWFPILGRYHKRIRYIDGFAGPGQYEEGEDGSPLIAINSALQHVDRGTLRRDITVDFLFIESRPDFLTHLRQRIALIALPDTFSVQLSGATFREELEPALTSLATAGDAPVPTFAFVDPFGFKGIPFDIMAQLLSHPRCEIFINVMVEFINRFLEHPNDKVVAHFPETFGTDEVLSISRQSGNRKEALLELHRSQLKTKAQYVGRFDMENRKHRTIYSLFFASNSERGFEKMKEAMWAVDRGAGMLFSDSDPKGLYSFDLFATHRLGEILLQDFHGKLVPMHELEHFVICETDYLPKHLREQLKQRESRGEIEVVPRPGCKRRRGTFPRDKVGIRFR